MKQSRYTFYTAVAFGALMLGGKAGAEETAAAQTPPPQSALADDTQARQEIVVTANRREETLQKAPVAITAVSGDSLVERGVTNLISLSTLIPSARFATSTSGVVQASLRGIGSNLDTPYVPEPVAVNINDSYVPRLALGGALFDVAQIEALPGPQATLYGKSAIGGVINIRTNEPQRELGADFTVEAGNYDYVQLTGVVNAPIGEDLAIRVAGNYKDRDAYFTNGTDDDNVRAIRISGLYDRDDVSVLLWGSYFEQKATPQSTSFVLPFLNDDPYDQPATNPVTGLAAASTFLTNKNYMAGARVKVALGPVELTYIPSYLELNMKGSTGVFGLDIRSAFDIVQTTQELRINSDLTEKLSLFGSLYYYHTKTGYSAIANIPGLGALGGEALTAVSSGYAGLAQLRYEVTDAIRLTVGGRYSIDEMTPRNAVNIAGPPATGLPDTIEIPFAFPETKRWKNFDWKIAVDADVGPNSMIYGNVQTGYSPGGYRGQPVAGGGAGSKLKKQTMLGFTIGIKNRFLDGKLQINNESFLYYYDDYLISGLTDIGLPFFGAVPKARIYGNQLDVVIAPSRSTRLNLGFSYLKTEITRAPADATALKGNELGNAPEFNIIGGIEHDFMLADDSKVTLRVNSSFNSGYWGTFRNFNGLKQDEFTRTDLSVTYTTADELFSFSGFVRNIEDSAVFGGQENSPATYPPPFERVAFLDAPRTYGIRMKVRFGAD